MTFPLTVWGQELCDEFSKDKVGWLLEKGIYLMLGVGLFLNGLALVIGEFLYYLLGVPEETFIGIINPFHTFGKILMGAIAFYVCGYLLVQHMKLKKRVEALEK